VARRRFDFAILSIWGNGKKMPIGQSPLYIVDAGARLTAVLGYPQPSQTMCSCLGISHEMELHDRQEKPFSLAPWGKPVAELLM
jgi:hypothetical protein